jgi:Tfp pilus assembly protein FimT
MNTWQASRFREGPGSLILSGYVFPEILAVVGILAILILVAMPRLELPETLNAATFARQVAVDLRLAQQLAIARRVNYTLEFSPDRAPYKSYTIRNEAAVVEEPDFPKLVPGGVSVSGRRVFTFTSGGWGPYEENKGSDGALTIAAGSSTATVTVYWYNGRVQVTVP